MVSRLRHRRLCLSPSGANITIAEKIRILKAVEAAAPGKQGAVLRREGIYSSQVSTWRRQLERGDLDQATMRKRVRIKDESKAADRRIAELERETVACGAASNARNSSEKFKKSGAALGDGHREPRK